MILEALSLSASGRPLLVVGEVELLLVDRVDMQFEGSGGPPGQLKPKHEDGYAVLTTHRLMWIDSARAPAAGASCGLSLSCVQHVQSKASHIFGTPKLRAQVHVSRDNTPVPGGRDAVRTVQLKMTARDPGPLAQAMAQALSQRAWERATAQTARQQAAAVQAPAQQAAPGPPPGTDTALLRQLTDMGFPYWRVVRGLSATNSAGADEAVGWILQHQMDAGVDEPLPSPAQPAAGAQRQVASFSTASAGIAGILRREERMAAATDETMEKAFKDLRGLMERAQEMVELAERFRGKRGGQGDRGAPEEAMGEDMENELISLGIASPVTKDMAGALYHQQLSRQLADFLVKPLQTHSGIMALPDVYCLFNRARGTELVSPDDLLAAVALFPKIGAPMALRTFASGLLVVQSSLHSDAEVCRQLQALVPGPGLGPSLTASDVARALQVPLPIASEHLTMAEGAAVLCRDDGPEGLRFFRNFFPEAACSAA
ncbi:hypothetical protein WJX73_006449 [Symbiochloris irregularis]|uniref:Vacuolar protein-sorting-associated protein 36 n=1 Tax=Symbiochloris irregularis TaxID=706552 RepID=A0AAW1P0E5_9CHLO